jgi:predicted membrane metal-binding protein
LQRLSIRIKKRLQQGLYAQASAMTAGILAAVVLGDKKGVPPAVYRAMAKNGTVHILVVSGSMSESSRGWSCWC